jgi:hypothetical protein
MTSSPSPLGPSAAETVTSPRRRSGRAFAALFGLGLIGVATLPFEIIALLRTTTLPGLPDDWPLLARVALLMVNPVLYLAGGVALGLRFAPRVGLRSLVAEWGWGVPASARGSTRDELKGAVVPAVASGVALGLVTAGIDAVTSPMLGPAWAEASAKLGAQEGTGFGVLLSGLFYGGITEEIMLRWGVMSLLVWLMLRATGRRTDQARNPRVLGAIVLASLVFGASHLGALQALVPLTPAVVIRTIVLNALGGVVSGWWFWRRHLEAAMLVHAGAHVGVACVALLGAS